MINFKIQYNKNTLPISVNEFVDLYLYGVPLTDKHGNTIPANTLKFYIQSAQEEIEHYLGIKLQKQIIEESKDYFLSDWQAWGYMRTAYPVNKIFELKGFVNTVQQMDIPKEWLSIKYGTEQNMRFRQINVVPVAATSVQYSTIYSGVVPLGFFANSTIPNYWKAVYTTGFDIIPKDILNFIGKFAAIGVFHLLGDLILGTPGITSKSISIDGLSQSYTTQSGFSQRINGYMKDLEIAKEHLYNYYKGVTVISL